MELETSAGRVRCAKCNKIVYVAEQRNFQDKAYHAKCFQCCVCKQQLLLTGVHTHDSRLVCQTHHAKLVTECAGRTDNVADLLDKLISDHLENQLRTKAEQDVRKKAEEEARNKLSPQGRSRVQSMDKSAASTLRTKAKSVRRTTGATGIINVLAQIGGSKSKGGHPM